MYRDGGGGVGTVTGGRTVVPEALREHAIGRLPHKPPLKGPELGKNDVARSAWAC